MTRWCDNCKNRETCKKYKEEMQSPMAKFFQGCLGGYEEEEQDKYSDLIVFDDQPKRQLKDPGCHNE